MLNPYALYLVTDSDLCPRENLISVVEQGILGGVSMVQLREKNIDTMAFYREALELKKLASRYHVPLLINDRLDIALAIDADGLHIGQNDLPVSVARKLLGKEKILGVSVDTLEQASLAKNEGADYFGVGALFPTSTKKDASSVKIETASTIKKEMGLPVVGIGGINENTMPQLFGSRIDGVAIVSGIMSAKEPYEMAKKLRNMVDML